MISLRILAELAAASTVSNGHLGSLFEWEGDVDTESHQVVL